MFFLLALSSIPTGWHAYSQILLSFEPKFACADAQNVFNFTYNFTEYRYLAVPGPVLLLSSLIYRIIEIFIFMMKGAFFILTWRTAWKITENSTWRKEKQNVTHLILDLIRSIRIYPPKKSFLQWIQFIAIQKNGFLTQVNSQRPPLLNGEMYAAKSSSVLWESIEFFTDQSCLP